MLDIQHLLFRFVFDFIDLVGKAGTLGAEGKSKSKKLRQSCELIILKREEEKKKLELADKKVLFLNFLSFLDC